MLRTHKQSYFQNKITATHGLRDFADMSNRPHKLFIGHRYLIPAYNALAGCAKAADRGGGHSIAPPAIMDIK